MFFWLKKTGLAQGRPKNLPTYLGSVPRSGKVFGSWFCAAKPGFCAARAAIERHIKRFSRFGGQKTAVFNGARSNYFFALSQAKPGISALARSGRRAGIPKFLAHVRWARQVIIFSRVSAKALFLNFFFVRKVPCKRVIRQ